MNLSYEAVRSVVVDLAMWLGFVAAAIAASRPFVQRWQRIENEKWDRNNAQTDQKIQASIRDATESIRSLMTDDTRGPGRMIAEMSKTIDGIKQDTTRLQVQHENTNERLEKVEQKLEDEILPAIWQAKSDHTHKQ